MTQAGLRVVIPGWLCEATPGPRKEVRGPWDRTGEGVRLMVKVMKSAMLCAGFALMAATTGCSAQAAGPSPAEQAMQREFFHDGGR